jgi:hypothetical protein
MGAHEQAQTVLSVWIGQLVAVSQFFCLRGQSFGHGEIGPVEMPETHKVQSQAKLANKPLKRRLGVA